MCGSVPLPPGLPIDLDQLEAYSLAWARAFPTVVLVPAFGLRALAAPARGVVGLALAASIGPALLPVVQARAGEPWIVLALEELLVGLPVALAAAVPLWAATMAGGLADALRGSAEGSGSAVVEGRPSSFGVLFSMFASAVFLSTGGPARAAEALTRASFSGSPVVDAASTIASGIGMAVAIGGPLLAASVILELAFALMARASTPAQIHALLAPIRSLGLLAVVAIVLERVSTLLALATRSAP